MQITSKLNIKNDIVRLEIIGPNVVHYHTIEINPNAEPLKIITACIGRIKTFGRMTNGIHFVTIRTNDARLDITQADAERLRAAFCGGNVRNIEVYTRNGRKI